MVILSADSTYKWGSLDAGIAVENMALAAEGLGLGSLIIGCILDAMQGEKKAHFAAALDFPADYEYKIAIAFGHKAVTLAARCFARSNGSKAFLNFFLIRS